jgi:hypothetical protein
MEGVVEKRLFYICLSTLIVESILIFFIKKDLFATAIQYIFPGIVIGPILYIRNKVIGLKTMNIYGSFHSNLMILVYITFFIVSVVQVIYNENLLFPFPLIIVNSLATGYYLFHILS